MAAAYLARSGRRVLVLERRETLGGCSVTEEVWPGYRVSTAAYLTSLLEERVIRDLELEKFGYQVDAKDPAFFSEWIDSYYARDIQELFRVRNRAGFLRLFRLLLLQSGGLADWTALARQSELSRPTVMAHVEALGVAHAIFPVSPFAGGGRREVVRRPNVYAFDTGLAGSAQARRSRQARSATSPA